MARGVFPFICLLKIPHVHDVSGQILDPPLLEALDPTGPQQAARPLLPNMRWLPTMGGGQRWP